jgi:glycosyltransferase involved in cell wall biosynthesis
VLCSITEGLPGALIEAAMAGLPAAATDVGFVRDIVDDGVTGRLVPVGDIAATAAALEECLSHRDHWGGRARRNAMASFEKQLVVDRWFALLTDVTQAAHRP